MADPSSMFDKLAQQKIAESTTPDVSSSEPKAKRSRPKGKRSHPDYTQVGAYIPKTLSKRVKMLLLEEEKDFSELVTELLEEWVNQQSG